MIDNQSVCLDLPLGPPTVLDLAVSYLYKLIEEQEGVEGSLIDLELNVANAQRIALAARTKSDRLKDEIEELRRQISHIRESLKPN